MMIFRWDFISSKNFSIVHGPRSDQRWQKMLNKSWNSIKDERDNVARIKKIRIPSNDILILFSYAVYKKRGASRLGMNSLCCSQWTEPFIFPAKIPANSINLNSINGYSTGWLLTQPERKMLRRICELYHSPNQKEENFTSCADDAFSPCRAIPVLKDLTIILSDIPAA